MAAGRLGLTVADVSQQLSSAWLGEVATEYFALDRTIPVRVRYPDAIRLDGGRLGQTMIRGTEVAPLRYPPWRPWCRRPDAHC